MRNLMITHYAVPHEKGMKSMEMLAGKVFPRFA